MSLNSDQFFSSLPINELPLGDLLTTPALFKEVPADWTVVLTDIKSSTQAVLDGQHQNINLIATGSIVTVLNIAFGKNITVPFFFGGDGATFIIPPSIIDKIMQALSLYKANTLSNFGLELRTGAVSVEEIYAQGHQLQLARFSHSAVFSIPILLGNGLSYAEQLIKGASCLLSGYPPQEEELDLTGMQCRWDKIAPPADQDEVVTLLVVARNNAHQADTFRKVMDKIEQLYGPLQQRQPISVAKLKLKTSFGNLGNEMRARLGKIKWLELIHTWLINLYGYLYFSTASGKTYLKTLVEMSDTLVIDGRINTVISGKEEQRLGLQAFLDQLEKTGELIYGLHVSTASVMSCYVRDLKDGHIHFVDGSEGGYTFAARMLKTKFSTLSSSN